MQGVVGRDFLGKLGVDADFQALRGLLLGHADAALLDVLAAHPNHIRATLACVEAQGEGEAFPRAGRPVVFKLLDLIVRPALDPAIALAGDFGLGDGVLFAPA